MSYSDKKTSIDWRYKALMFLLAPLIIAHTLFQSFQTKNARLAKQRLGLNIPKQNSHPLWIHMASVGEVNAALPLIKEIQKHAPDTPLLLSTFTPTGADNVAAKLGNDVTHIFLPLDFSFPTQRFLKQTSPRAAIILETEIWPQLYKQCHHLDIPLVIVNGRLSERSMNKPRWIKHVMQKALQNVDLVLARSDTDGQRFRELGCTKQQLRVVDNIKFTTSENDNADIQAIKLPRPYVLAASTHDDEELQISYEWLTSPLKETHLLVIAPRHPKRKDTIVKQLQPLDSKLAVRSEHKEVTDETEIYLADTFGELQRFIAGAEAIYMGGSIIPRGGQNVIEVARQGKTALFGPHMENFADEKALLLANQGAFEISDANALIKKLESLLEQPEKLLKTGKQAQKLIYEKGNVAARYFEALKPYL